MPSNRFLLDGFIRAIGSAQGTRGKGARQQGEERQSRSFLRSRSNAAHKRWGEGGAEGGALADPLSAWNASLVVGPFHPTYYGMMTAMFHRSSDGASGTAPE